MIAETEMKNVLMLSNSLPKSIMIAEAEMKNVLMLSNNLPKA